MICKLQVNNSDICRQCSYLASLKAFPGAFGESEEKRIQALIKVTHEISDYRLVIKKEPFKPVILRVHSDPISILGKLKGMKVYADRYLCTHRNNTGTK
jgi:hypothetical protein